MEGGCFAWGAAEPAVLRDVDLRVARGQLVAVVGAVGAGKSSLLAALLGELECRAGRVNTVVGTDSGLVVLPAISYTLQPSS